MNTEGFPTNLFINVVKNLRCYTKSLYQVLYLAFASADHEYTRAISESGNIRLKRKLLLLAEKKL